MCLLDTSLESAASTQGGDTSFQDSVTTTYSKDPPVREETRLYNHTFPLYSYSS
ncbi:hypothetical protein Hdeb2414_s0003g00112551 [Helianthus debilis subsp. tardiflorus]